MLPVEKGILWMLFYTVALQVNHANSASTTPFKTSSSSSSLTTTGEQTTVTPPTTETPIVYNCSDQCLPPPPPTTPAPCVDDQETTTPNTVSGTPASTNIVSSDSASNCNETSDNCTLTGNNTICDNCTLGTNVTNCDNSTGNCSANETESNGCANVTYSGDVPDNRTCDTTSGACLHGCQDGFAMPLCDIRCPTDCSRCTHTNETTCEACNGNNYLEDGQCTACQTRCVPSMTSTSPCFMNNGTCRFGCINGTYTKDDCSKGCPVLCKDRKCDQFSGFCVDGCIKPQYCSDTCSQPCAPGCRGQDCDQDCTCRNDCNNDFYGAACKTRCPDNCIKQSETTTKCNATTGSCIYGCTEDKWWGDKCQTTCSTNCRGGTCLPEDGNCTDGCNENWFGPDCSFPCYMNCVNQTCSEVNGTCLEGCRNGWYGPTCEQRCSFTCKNDICNDTTGECTDGCSVGWFGTTCYRNCSKTCSGKECDFDSGTCTKGCSPGFEGDKCLNQTLVKPEDPKDSLEVNIGIGVGSAVVVGVTLAVVCGKRRRRERILRGARRGLNRLTKIFSGDYGGLIGGAGWIAPDDYADPLELFAEPQSRIQVEDILTEVIGMSSSRFREEFKKLETGIIKECTAAKRLENMTKNFYSDIFPYDDNRVTLQIDQSRESLQPGSDYINASYIRGLKKERKYIAAQGPAKATVNDFWRMVWQENTTTIVMLITLAEDGSENYWPEGETVSTYGSLTLKCVFRQPFADFIFREFKLTKDNQDRVVRHLQYTRWPHRGMPPSAVDLIEFHQKYRAIVKEYTPSGPIVVHCTAGVSRTGVFIALDIAVDDVMANGSCDLLETVQRLRQQRLQIVQLISQYQFLYEVVAQEVVFGCILTSKAEFQKTYERLQIVQNWGKSQLQQSFQDCNKSMALDDQDIACFNPLQERGRKDRPTSDIPEVRYRPELEDVPYINAVNLDTYARQDAIVATQMPSPETMAEFCQLVIQKRCSTIVMLNVVDKKDKSLCLYWTSRLGRVYGKIKVTSRKVKKYPTYVLRNVFFEEQVKKGEGPSKKHEVKMIQFTAWDFETETVPKADPFLELVGIVRRQMNQAPDTSLLVHCLNGSDQSALFCVLYNLIEKADSENYINVVTTVRKVKTRRPTGLHKIAQYEFCYEAFISYLRNNSMLSYAAMTSGSGGTSNAGYASEGETESDDTDYSDDDIDFGFRFDDIRMSSAGKEKIYDSM